MTCPTCNGRGTIDGLTQVYPCPDCLGGAAHCCEGDQAQVDPQEDGSEWAPSDDKVERDR